MANFWEGVTPVAVPANCWDSTGFKACQSNSYSRVQNLCNAFTADPALRTKCMNSAYLNLALMMDCGGLCQAAKPAATPTATAAKPAAVKVSYSSSPSAADTAAAAAAATASAAAADAAAKQKQMITYGLYALGAVAAYMIYKKKFAK